MATVQTLIDRALRMNGRLGSGRSPTANETADCLIALNAMLGSWRNERLLAYALVEHSLTLTANDGQYTIGSGGDINTTRPVKIESAFCRDDDLDTPIEVIDKTIWDRIGDKTETAEIVEYLYYDPAMSSGNLNFWPIPSVANAVKITVWAPLSEFSAASDTVTLPPGYEDALAYNLAVRISPEYGEGVTPLVIQLAQETKAAIKRVNIPRTTVNTDLSGMFSRQRVNIENDG